MRLGDYLVRCLSALAELADTRVVAIVGPGVGKAEGSQVVGRGVVVAARLAAGVLAAAIVVVGTAVVAAVPGRLGDSGTVVEVPLGCGHYDPGSLVVGCVRLVKAGAIVQG